MRAAIVLVVILLAPASLAAPDPTGDVLDGDPDHDLVEGEILETPSEVRFRIRVAGTTQGPAGALHEYGVDFRVVAADAYAPRASVQLAGTRHRAGIGDSETYGVFRNGFGLVLPAQPVFGGSAIEIRIPKAYLEATPLSRPRAGDWIADVRIVASYIGLTADVLDLPDHRLAFDTPAGTALHLAAGGALAPEAPRGGLPERTLVARDMPAEWRSAPLAAPFPVDEPAATLWLSATTSGPILSDERLVVELWDEAPDGSRVRVARRVEETSSASGATTNVFGTPLVPQRLVFQLGAVAPPEVPNAHRLVLRVATTGFLADESGPVVVWSGSEDRDSVVSSAS